MTETRGTDPRAAATWMVAWLFTLILLAFVPSAHAADGVAGNGAAPTLYYAHGLSSLNYQDPSGMYSVSIRSLRPVFSRRSMLV